MSIKNRGLWYQKSLILKKQGILKFNVVYRSNTFIDKRGISLAIKDCINEALEKLDLNQGNCAVLLDGSLYAPKEYKNQKTIIKGDQKEKIISLSSVIAKVSRDKKMDSLHRKYPKYNWLKNKGYGTKEHYIAIGKYGESPLHRKTFLKN